MKMHYLLSAQSWQETDANALIVAVKMYVHHFIIIHRFIMHAILDDIMHDELRFHSPNPLSGQAVCLNECAMSLFDLLYDAFGTSVFTPTSIIHMSTWSMKHVGEPQPG